MASPQPRIGVVTYPGSQDDRDALWALAALDAEAIPVWHEERDLPDLDAVGGARVKATVLVRPKQGILDPQGQAVETALEHLGFSVSAARVGKVVDIEIDATDPAEARAQVEKMCEQLLANPLMESYEVEIHG